MKYVVVMLENHRFGAGPARVFEITNDPIDVILARHTDRDGARSERLRIWLAFDGCSVGDVVTTRLVCGTGRGALKAKL